MCLENVGGKYLFGSVEHEQNSRDKAEKHHTVSFSDRRMIMATVKTQPKRPFGDSYLQAYSEEHLFYEIDMLFGVGTLLSKPTMVGVSSAADAALMRNLKIEGFVLHLRNVIDFLYISPKPTDLSASDFCKPGIWDTARPAMSQTLSEARTRANKEMAHLTTGRQFGTPVTKQWDFSGLLAEVQPLLAAFLSEARQDALPPDVAKLIRQIIKSP